MRRAIARASVLALVLSSPAIAQAPGGAKPPAGKPAASDAKAPAATPAPSQPAAEKPSGAAGEEPKPAPAAEPGESGPPPRANEEAPAAGESATPSGELPSPTGTAATTADSAASADASKPAGGAQESQRAESTPGAKPTSKKRGPAVIATMTVDEPSKPEEPPEPPGLGNYQKHFEVGVGFRANWVADEGYHQFSDDPFLPQVAVGAGYSFFANDALSVAARLTWDYGGQSETLRGVPSRIELHRIMLGPSLRYHLHRKVFVFGTVAPGLRASQTVLDTGGVVFSARQFAFAMDLTLGGQVELIGAARNDVAGARWWVGVEGGYSVGTTTDVVLEPGEGTPARTDPIVLEPIELSGGILRITTSVTF